MRSRASTKIDSSVRTAELIPDTCGYEVYRNDRSLHGGGVMLLIKSHIPQMPLAELDNGSESVWAKIMVNGSPHFVGSWYRPPDSTCDAFLLFREQLDRIKSICPSNKLPNVHVLGDFNYGNIDWSTGLNKNCHPLNNTEGNLLLDAMNEHGLNQLVNFPTREQNTLDLIISSGKSQFTNVHSPDKLSDHDIVSATLNVSVPPVKVKRRKRYLYDKGNYDSMRSDASKFAKDRFVNGLASSRDIEQNWTMVKSFLSRAVEDHVPSKLGKAIKGLPWVNNRIRRMIRRRNKTHAMAKRFNSARLKLKWQNLRKQIKSEIQSAHSTYINNMVGDVREDPKPFWKYINRQKKDTQGIPPLKNRNGHLAESDKDKAQTLNDQFTSVFTKFTGDAVPFLRRKFPKMDDIKVTVKGVTKLLKGLNPSKASGPDKIHPKILKELAEELGPVLAHIFQQSIDSGRIPEDWSKANICPLYKKRR